MDDLGRHDALTTRQPFALLGPPQSMDPGVSQQNIVLTAYNLEISHMEA